MSKFYEVSKVLDKHTDAINRVQFLVRWRGYDSWVDAEDTNEYLKQVFRTRHQGSPGLLQTLSILVAEKLRMKKPPSTSIVRRVSVTMPMDPETFRELFSRLPSAPNLLRATKFSVPGRKAATGAARRGMLQPPRDQASTPRTCAAPWGRPLHVRRLPYPPETDLAQGRPLARRL